MSQPAPSPLVRDAAAALRAALSQQMYKSAVLWGTFIVNADNCPPFVPEGVAVALEALREQRRAAHFYQLCDPSPTPPPTPSLPPCSAHPVCAAARQHMLARDHAEASSCLDAYIQTCAAAGVKPTALALLLSGSCALRSKCEAEAALFFRDALASEPCCIEAVPELLRLGAKEEDVRALLQPITSQMPFIAVWLRALSSQHADYFAAAAAAIEDLSTSFIYDSVPFLLLRARAQFEQGQMAGACALYARVRTLDPCCLDGMSYYAEALAHRGGGAVLAKFVTDCLNISPSNSDGWLAAALHWKSDLSRMSELLEKVTANDPQCVHAHLLEAELHLERRQYAAALFSARNAHALQRSVRSYSALVKTYLGQSRSKDALVVAKELMESQPRSARALVVMGTALAAWDEGVEKAKRALERALRIDATCAEAVLELGVMYTNEGKGDDAIALYREFLRHHTHVGVMCALGSALVARSDSVGALGVYMLALGVDPSNTRVKLAIDQLDGIVNGSAEDSAITDPQTDEASYEVGY